MKTEEAIKWVDNRMCFGRGTFTEHHLPNIDECWQAGVMAIRALEMYDKLVRCKDCRWYERSKAKIFENCCRNNYLIPMKPNDYCSYGERREDGEV